MNECPRIDTTVADGDPGHGQPTRLSRSVTVGDARWRVVGRTSAVQITRVWMAFTAVDCGRMRDTTGWSERDPQTGDAMDKAPASPLGRALYYASSAVGGVFLATFWWNLFPGDLVFGLVRCFNEGSATCPAKPTFPWALVIGCAIVGLALGFASSLTQQPSARSQAAPRPPRPGPAPAQQPGHREPPPRHPTSPGARTGPPTAGTGPAEQAGTRQSHVPASAAAGARQPRGMFLADARFNGLMAASGLVVAIIALFV